MVPIPMRLPCFSCHKTKKYVRKSEKNRFVKSLEALHSREDFLSAGGPCILYRAFGKKDIEEPL